MTTVSVVPLAHVFRRSREGTASAFVNEYQMSLEAAPPGSQVAVPSFVAVASEAVTVAGVVSTVADAHASLAGTLIGGAPGATANWNQVTSYGLPAGDWFVWLKVPLQARISKS